MSRSSDFALVDSLARPPLSPLPPPPFLTGRFATGNGSSQAIVSSITQRPGFSTSLIVTGDFETAGSLPCRGICQWNTGLRQWSSLGANGLGLEAGSVVRGVEFAGVRDCDPSPRPCSTADSHDPVPLEQLGTSPRSRVPRPQLDRLLHRRVLVFDAHLVLCRLAAGPAWPSPCCGG